MNCWRRAEAVAGRSLREGTCGGAASGSPDRQRLVGRGPLDQRPWRHMRRRPRRVLPYGQQPWPALRLGRRPLLREPSRHEQRRHRRTAGGSRRRRQARHERRLASGRWRPGGADRPALPPRTTPARALRRPLPTPRRSAGRFRSASAESPCATSSRLRRSAQNPGPESVLLSGIQVNDMVRCWWSGGSGAGREHDDLAGERAGGRLGVDRRQLGQRDALGDVDAQLAAVDQRRPAATAARRRCGRRRRRRARRAPRRRASGSSAPC